MAISASEVYFLECFCNYADPCPVLMWLDNFLIFIEDKVILGTSEGIDG